MSRLSEQQILSRARASSLENVRNLNFWGSDLNDISVLRQMPNVEVLSLSVNNITSLKDFAYCTRLRELYLRKNCINDISEIGCLRNLPRLRVLWLSDNPCADQELYRMTVLRNLPKLTKLDTLVVEEDEVLKAAKEGNEIPIPVDIPVHFDFTASDESVLNHDAHTDGPDVATEHVNQEKTSHSNLVQETNKLRAQLGLKPLVLEDQPKNTSAITVKKVQEEGQGRSHERRSQNVLSAVLILIQELDRSSLLTLQTEINQQLQELHENNSNSSQQMIEYNEEKETITD